MQGDGDMLARLQQAGKAYGKVRALDGLDLSLRAGEVTALWEYISDRLEKNFRRTVFSSPVPQQPGYGTVRPMGGGFGRRIAGQ